MHLKANKLFLAKSNQYTSVSSKNLKWFPPHLTNQLTLQSSSYVYGNFHIFSLSTFSRIFLQLTLIAITFCTWRNDNNFCSFICEAMRTF